MSEDRGIKKRRRLSRGSITIYDVAARAGTSAMTVSRVVNGRQVSDALRERVEVAIRELDFTPNTSARRLAAVKGATLALLYDNPSSGFMGELLIGVLDEGARLGAQILVHKHGGDEPLGQILTSLRRGSAEGVILVPPLSDAADVAEKIASSGLAAVSVSGTRTDLPISTVQIDNQAAAEQVAEYLLGLGHRKFAFIAGRMRQAGSDHRQIGFLGRLAAAGIPSESILVEWGDYTYASGLAAAERILEQPERPTALFAANDEMAAAALAVAQMRGMTCPRDLSIVGFDDTLLARSVVPGLTTVHQPIAAMAASAVAILMSAIFLGPENSSELKHVVKEHRLLVRGSTGPAALQAP